MSREIFWSGCCKPEAPIPADPNDTGLQYVRCTEAEAVDRAEQGFVALHREPIPSGIVVVVMVRDTRGAH